MANKHVDGGTFLDPVLGPEVTSVAVVSDLHLGAAGTIDPRHPEAPAPGRCVLDEDEQLERLAHHLTRHQVYVDAVILCGDMCDFALATMDRTLISARRFIRRLATHGKQFIYVPGNHDHHAWLLANEVHELLVPFPDVDVPYLRRTERMYKSTYLQKLSIDPVHADDPDAEATADIFIAYPNVYWTPPKGGGRACVFHHGHYCEDLYSIVWTLLDAAFPNAPQHTLESLEAASFGWLEMIWYQLGQAGKGLGADGLIEHLYQQIESKGPAVLEGPLKNLYDTLLAPLVHRALDSKMPSMGPRIHHFIDHHLPTLVVHMISSYAKVKVERGQGPGAAALRFAELDAKLAERCDRYLERTRTSHPGLPPLDRISFFFGHTHKAGVWPVGTPPRLFNDGGWIRHADGAWPDAHVLVIDEAAGVKDLRFAERDADCTFTTLR